MLSDKGGTPPRPPAKAKEQASPTEPPSFEPEPVTEAELTYLRNIWPGPVPPDDSLVSLAEWIKRQKQNRVRWLAIEKLWTRSETRVLAAARKLEAALAEYLPLELVRSTRQRRSQLRDALRAEFPVLDVPKGGRHRAAWKELYPQLMKKINSIADAAPCKIKQDSKRELAVELMRVLGLDPPVKESVRRKGAKASPDET